MTGSTVFGGELAARCEAEGLDVRSLEQHRRRLLGSRSGQFKSTFDLVDSCRIDNGRLLPEGWPKTSEQGGAASGVVAFVPAAGAASRYFKPFADLPGAIDEARLDDATAILRGLESQGARKWPLPEAMTKTIATVLDGGRPDATLLADARRELALSKALLPCVREGATFLAMKFFEHEHLRGLEGQVYVAPNKGSALFSRQVERERLTRGPRFEILEQGPVMSTIRMFGDGSPVIESDGGPSVVPGGHGALARLFPEVKRLFPKAHSLFIRNIDNLMGSRAEAIAASERFLRTHGLVLDRLRGLRKALAARDHSVVQRIADEMLGWVSTSAVLDGEESSWLASLGDKWLQRAWEVQLRLFHTRPDFADPRARGVEAVAALFERPLNTMGQVPNTGRDVGGTPVLVRTPRGVQKVCLEVPHASDADRRTYFENPAKATHFNPVFVASEMTDRADFYESEDNPFWLIAAKSYRGKDVFYHESLLYELLGNSLQSNSIFLEVPRLVFNPTKSLDDAAGRALSDWVR